jgi:hypothetical protein
MHGVRRADRQRLHRHPQQPKADDHRRHRADRRPQAREAFGVLQADRPADLEQAGEQQD